MKRRRCKEHNYRIGTARFFILAGLTIGLLGVSFAAYSNILTAGFHISTSNFSFIFDNDKKVVVRMQNGSDGTLHELHGKAEYQDKKLIITDIGPIDMQDLMNGDAIITIDYAIKASDEEHGIMRAAEINETRETGYDLGTVDFRLTSHTPVWNLINENGRWGTESMGIEKTPDLIYQYLPDDLGTFHVYNQLMPDIEDGIMVGTLLLKQECVPAIPDSDEINLSSLSLPEGICEEIKEGSQVSSLEITAGYSFAIPLNLDQFNLVQ